MSKGNCYIDTSPLNSAPALYERYVNSSQPAVDEWTLSQAMAADTANGGLNQLENHYNTFIVRFYYALVGFCHSHLLYRPRKILRKLLALA